MAGSQVGFSLDVLVFGGLGGDHNLPDLRASFPAAVRVSQSNF